MYAFVALLIPALSDCVTLTYNQPDLISKSKVELAPVLITCGLNDIAIISAPVVDTDSANYLHKPNGDVIKLDIPRQATKLNDINESNEIGEHDNIDTIYNNKYVRPLHPIENFRVFSTSYRNRSNEDVVKEREGDMKGNDFVIGPLLEEDHGNWVLSVYFKDIDDNWIELFQVITVEIVERVPVVSKRHRVRAGDTFHLGFAYPIQHLQSCELIAPDTTSDRYFDRNRTDLDRCEYVVDNVTREDGGVWTIIGVGRVVYAGHVNLNVRD